LAHQSALAGVLLAAALARSAAGCDPEQTQVTRVDVLKRLADDLTQPAQAGRDGRCLCDDPDYLNIYRNKYRLITCTSDSV
jgi:hypothetical protein